MCVFGKQGSLNHSVPQWIGVILNTRRIVWSLYSVVLLLHMFFMFPIQQVRCGDRTTIIYSHPGIGHSNGPPTTNNRTKDPVYDQFQGQLLTSNSIKLCYFLSKRCNVQLVASTIVMFASFFNAVRINLFNQHLL